MLWSTRDGSRARTNRGPFACLRLPRHIRAAVCPCLAPYPPGFPSSLWKMSRSHVSIPLQMASESDEVFALRVRGDSMIDDHIVDGDVIVVRKQDTAEHGQIVAVLIGDEATVKRLDLHSQPPRLLPANPNYDPIALPPGNRSCLVG